MSYNDRVLSWIDSVLNNLAKFEENKGIELLYSCGSNCAKTSPLLEAAINIRNEHKNEKDTDSLFNAFKAKFYNSPNLTKEDDQMTLIFEECTCPLVKGGISNSYLCNCTVGYTIKIFETLFNQKVEVVLKQSILKGNHVCEQIIRIN